MIHCPEGAWGVEHGQEGAWVPSWKLAQEEIVGSVGAGDAFALAYYMATMNAGR